MQTQWVSVLQEVPSQAECTVRTCTNQHSRSCAKVALHDARIVGQQTSVDHANRQLSTRVLQWLQAVPITNTSPHLGYASP